MTATTWSALGPQQFIDRRSMLRLGRHQIVNVRAYHGVVTRKGEDGKQEYDHCPHAHQKPSAARKCAEAAAKRWNKKGL